MVCVNLIFCLVDDVENLEMDIARDLDEKRVYLVYKSPAMCQCCKDIVRKLVSCLEMGEKVIGSAYKLASTSQAPNPENDVEDLGPNLSEASVNSTMKRPVQMMKRGVKNKYVVMFFRCFLLLGVPLDTFPTKIRLHPSRLVLK